ncbi:MULTISPECIES: COR domain-containing protein [Methylobacter]
MLDSVKIKTQLKGLSDDQCVVFAVRAAMRVLPLLVARKKTTSKAFWFWKPEDKAKYLLDVYLAYSSSIERILVKSSDASYYSSTADFAANRVRDAYIARNTRTNVVYAAYAAADAATAAKANAATRGRGRSVYTTNANTANAAWVAAQATVLAAAAVHTDTAITQEIEADLEALNHVPAEALLMQPLWSKTVPRVWQRCLERFKNDALSLEAGFEVWLDWYEDRLEGKPIDLDLLKNWNRVPVEIASQGAEKVNAYFKNLQDETATQPLNRVRAIFIGYGESGKTSLIRSLHDEEVIKGNEAMTAGIEIRDWTVPDTDIQAHLWDFGGQVVFHSTHKFFLRSSCVYIIVINARADINNSEQAEYWLDHVKVFGDSAPVLLVGNKADEAQIHLQMQTLSQKYPNIKGFYPLSCTEAKTSHQLQFDCFKQALAEQLQAVGMHQMMFTPAQANVLDELRQYSPDHAFLSESDFNQICDKYGISNEGELNRDWLVDIFDKLGVMLHFEELKTFNNAYMLNPRWLTHGVYALMNAKQAKLNETEIVKILKEAKVEDEYKQLLSYPPDKCLFISKAMQRFKLCYPLPNGANSLMIPALLNDELSEYPPELQHDETLRFEFDFSGFLPRNLIGEFMVSRHEEIKDDLQSQRGAVFASKNLQAQALVEADYHRRLLVMQVYGRDAKEYLTILYDSMFTVFGELNLGCREWVNLPTSACLDQGTLAFNGKVEKAPYKQLLAYARNKEPKYISESGLKYDLNKVLGSILSEAEQVKQGITNNFFGQSPVVNQAEEQNVSNQNVHINNSTVNGSVVAAEKIENSFNSLQESKAGNEVKTLLGQLLTEIKALNGKVPDAQAQQFIDMTDGAETLITETGREAPRTKWYQLSLEGIKEAALAVGEVAKPVLEIAEKLAPLLL